jgi:hypothetical protein
MAQDTYWGSFEEISKYNVQLNYLEKMWMAWYSWMGNDVLATGIMSFVIHEVFYFGRSLPWIIIDCIPYFNRYKLQQVSLGNWAAHCSKGSLAAAQNSHRLGTDTMRSPRPPLPLHRRASPDLDVPPHVPVLRPRDLGPLP